MNLDLLISDLKTDEGYSAKIYYDSVGVRTIGYGTNIEYIDLEEAEWLLSHRVAKAARDLILAFPWVTGLDDVRQNVLINMAYNMGIARLSTFVNTLAAIQKGDWQAAHDGMLASLWAKQVGPRATRLAEQMLNGK